MSTPFRHRQNGIALAAKRGEMAAFHAGIPHFFHPEVSEIVARRSVNVEIPFDQPISWENREAITN